MWTTIERSDRPSVCPFLRLLLETVFRFDAEHFRLRPFWFVLAFCNAKLTIAGDITDERIALCLDHIFNRRFGLGIG